MKKRGVAALLALALALLLPGCGEEPAPAPVLSSVTIMADTDAALPLWDYVRQESGFEITLEVMPAKEICTALLLRHAAQQQLPDLVYLKNRADTHALAQSGVLQNLSDYKNDLPNYRRACFSTDGADEQLRAARAAFGGLYLLPDCGGRAGVARGWLYRADVFAAQNLKTPTTMQELSNCALALKRAHPESTPVALRGGLSGLDLIAPAWQSGAALGAYYDFAGQEWRFGATESWMGNFVSYWAGLARSGLLPQNYLTMSDAELDALIAQGRVFLIPDAIWRLDEFQKKYPDQNWQLMPAPRAATEGAQHKLAKHERTLTGYALCRTENEDRQACALRFLNWMYGDAAQQVLGWGRENESYRTDGLEKTLLAPAAQIGIGTDGLCTRIDPAAECNLTSQARVQNADLAAIYTEHGVNPARYVQFTPEESEKLWRAENKLKLVLDTALSDFLTGRRPMTEWAAFAKSLDTSELRQILDTYRRAYQRVEK